MTLIGIDYGSRRVGIAISDSHVLATPHSVIHHKGDVSLVIEKIAALGEQLQVSSYVLGIPRRRGAGDRHVVTKFEALAEALRQQSCRDVVLWDETLTTVEAKARAVARGARRRGHQNEIDMQAAAIILQSYLDSVGGRPS